MSELERVFEDLRSSSLFSVLPASALDRLGTAFKSCDYEAGASIYREGTSAGRFYLIRQGKVKIVRTSAAGAEMITSVYGRGDFVGCCCVLDALKLPCTAQAVGPTRVLYIEREPLMAMLLEYPELAVRLLQETTRRLRDADRKMKDLALERVDRRVVAALLELDSKFGTEIDSGARIIRICLTRAELAEMAGTTLETASRTMSKLKRAGWVSSTRGRIVLLSPQALASYMN